MNVIPYSKSAPAHIREARLEDFEEIYTIFQRVLRDGDTYSYTPEEMTPDRALAYWISAPGTHCYVADVDGKVAAVSAVRPNRTGRGNHVANASYIVDPDFRGRGIGKAMGAFLIEKARSLGYKDLQYNFVVSTNEVAVKLWKSLGFSIVGTLPKGFQHASKGLVDVYVMHRDL